MATPLLLEVGLPAIFKNSPETFLICKEKRTKISNYRFYMKNILLQKSCMVFHMIPDFCTTWNSKSKAKQIENYKLVFGTLESDD